MKMMTRTAVICLPLCSLGIVAAEEARDQLPSPRKPDTGAEPVEVKVEGAVLTYVPRPIPRGKRTARGEIDMIDGAQATLRLDRTVALRKTELASGTYRLRIHVEDGKERYLVIEQPAARADEKPEAPARSRRKGSSGGKKPKDPQALEKRKEKRDAMAGGAIPAEEPMEEEDEPEAKEVGPDEVDDVPEKKESAPRSLRAPLSLGTCEKSENSVTFDLKQQAKGSKLKILVRAGGTEGRATLRVVGD